MKIFNRFIMTFFLILFTFNSSLFAAKELFDDFSEENINGEKWQYREHVREVASGKLVSKLGNNASTGSFRNNNSFQNPESINIIECQITIVTTKLVSENESSSFARIGGMFYNAQNSGGATGDIWAEVLIGNRGNGGLEAYWEVEEILDDNVTSSNQLDSGTLLTAGTLDYGTPYEVKLAYDGDKGFIFTVAGASTTFSGPDRKAAAGFLFKGLSTGIDSDGGSDIGYVSAFFDDVRINNEQALYDDFSNAPLDPARWKVLEYVREITDEKLRLNIQANGAQRSAEIVPQDQRTKYFEAKVLVEGGSKLSSGAGGAARVAGWYYNEKRGPESGIPYDGNKDDVWVDIRLSLDSNNNLTANCFIWRSDSPDGSGPGTFLFDQPFSNLIAFDTMHTLSIKQVGKKFTFRCNNETYEYMVTTNMFEPSDGQYRQLLTRVYADPGQSGYMMARFDDVFTDRSITNAPMIQLLLFDNK